MAEALAAHFSDTRWLNYSAGAYTPSVELQVVAQLAFLSFLLLTAWLSFLFTYLHCIIHMIALFRNSSSKIVRNGNMALTHRHAPQK